ncbi:MAG: hypothetical protein AB9842_05010 [Bacteroidales bacterium]
MNKRDIRRKVVKQVSDLLKQYSIKTDLLGWINSNGNIHFIYPLDYNSGIVLGAGYYWDLFKGPSINFIYQYRIPLRPFTLNIQPGIGFYSLKSEITYSGHIIDSIYGGFYPMTYTKDKSTTALPLFMEAGLEKKFGRHEHWGLEASVGARAFLTQNLPETEVDEMHNKFTPKIKVGDDYKDIEDFWNKTLFSPGSPLYFKLKLIYYWGKH